MSDDAAAALAPLSRVQLAGMAGGAALVPLNSTMLAVALPRISNHFDISVGRTGLLVTVYLVTMLLGQPLAGRLGDTIGHRRIVTIGLIGFALTSVVGAFAPLFWVLVVARVGQALCGAAIGPGVQSLLHGATGPDERGRVFGFFGSIIGIGAGAGPILGGGLTQLFGWQAIFLVNVPIVVWALLAASRVAEHEPTRRAPDSAGGPSWVNPVFLACFALQALTNFGQYMLLLVTPVILEARNWSSTAIGPATAEVAGGRSRSAQRRRSSRSGSPRRAESGSPCWHWWPCCRSRGSGSGSHCRA